MRPLLSGAGAYLFLHKRTRTVLVSWSSLTSYSGQGALLWYRILYCIILHNIIGTDPALGTWPPQSIQISTYMTKGMGEKWLSPVKNLPSLYWPYTSSSMFYYFYGPTIDRGRPHTCFCAKGPGLSFLLEAV